MRTHDLKVVELQQQERVKRVFEQPPNPQSRASLVFLLGQRPSRLSRLLAKVRVVLPKIVRGCRKSVSLGSSI